MLSLSSDLDQKYLFNPIFVGKISTTFCEEGGVSDALTAEKFEDSFRKFPKILSMTLKTVRCFHN